MSFYLLMSFYQICFSILSNRILNMKKCILILSFSRYCQLLSNIFFIKSCFFSHQLNIFSLLSHLYQHLGTSFSQIEKWYLENKDFQLLNLMFHSIFLSIFLQKCLLNKISQISGECCLTFHSEHLKITLLCH